MSRFEFMGSSRSVNGTGERAGNPAMGSLLAEDLGSTPRRARLAAEEALARDGESFSLHMVDLVYAALLAGEPRRARRTLKTIKATDGWESASRLVDALGVWAGCLDGNWYPGDVSAVPPSFHDALMDTSARDRVAKRDGSEAALLEEILRFGPNAMLVARVMVDPHADGDNPATRAQAFNNAIAALTELGTYAEAQEELGIVGWALVTMADLVARSGRMAEAIDQFGNVERFGVDNGLPRVVGLSHIVQGDRHLSRGGSPETLGYNLSLTSPPAPGAEADIKGARTCYEAAEQLVSTAGLHLTSPRLVAALRLRRACLAWFERDLAAYRDHLEAASEGMADAGDAAGQRLIAVHLIVADIAQDRLDEVLQHIGSGWSAPTAGRLADIRSWAEADGSVSWCAGLGRLFQRVGEQWVKEGELDRASYALVAAMHLSGVVPSVRPYELVRTVADLDGDRNLTSRSLVRLERVLHGLGGGAVRGGGTDLAGGSMAGIIRWKFRRAFELLGRLDEVGVLTTIASAHDDRSQTAAAGQAAAALERVRSQLLSLADQRRLRDLQKLSWAELKNAEQVAGQQEMSRAWGRAAVGHLQDGIALTVQSWLGLLDLWIPLAKAHAAERLGLVFEADGWYDRAVETARRTGMPANHLLSALIAAGRLDAARQELAKVAGNWDAWDSTLAMRALECGEVDLAHQAFTRTGVDPLTTSDLGYVHTAARIALRRGDPSLALAIARRGIALFEDRLARLIRDVDRIAISDDGSVAGLYVTAIRASLASPEPAPTGMPTHATLTLPQAQAFEFTERARTLTMSTLLELDAVLPDDLRREWQSAAAEWAAATDNLLTGINTDPPTDPGDLVGPFDTAEHRLRDIETTIHRTHPGELGRHARPRPPLRLEALQERLPNGAALLEYHVLGDDLFLWAITRESVEVYERSVERRRFRRTIRDYWERCLQGSGAGAEQDELADLLIAPAAEVVRECSRVVVVPFGPLHAVPFHALPLDGLGLGLSHVVSYAPSASMALRDPIDTTFSLDEVTVVGDPAFDESRRPNLRRLPGAAVEASSIGHVVGARNLLVGEDATETAVRQALTERQVVHLATHGWLDELSPYQSSLVLAGSDELTVAELISLRMNAELAVLSACDSGRGMSTLGGDVVGLTRALMASGVRRALVSLWPVDDAAACVTMISFYRELLAGASAAYALASAQRTVHELSEPALRTRYKELSGPEPSAALGRRRGSVVSDPELLDDEAIPVPLGGEAERQWAPFVLVGA